MTIKGANFIGFSESANNNSSFKAFNPSINQQLEGEFKYANEKEFERALELAGNAFEVYRHTPAAKRAEFLKTIASEIMDTGEQLIKRCVAETGLAEGRIVSERGRTCSQLELFASLLTDGWWADARIDTGDASRTPLPKPDVRRMMIAIGPVAVFGSSNFPLAFSTAGGDTASALAAGCPVVVKAHSSHPGTNEIISSAIIRAAKKTGMPEGVFSSLYLSHEKSIDFVKHPAIKAVGFTGSRKVGMMLFHAGTQREVPIPVYAEMSAVNPVIIFEGALKEKSDQIASGLVDSITLGAGQFCTNPGISLIKKGPQADKFLQRLSENISKKNPSSMLNRNIYQSYSKAVDSMQKDKLVEVLGCGPKHADEKNEASPIIFKISAGDFMENTHLSQEIFGPASVMVVYNDDTHLLRVLKSMEGQLTATIHAGTGDDKKLLSQVVDIISEKAGRIVFGGFPTGVEVCHAMQHGGPFPSTTDSRSTSVGTAAINRFLRPVAYQNLPDQLLPEALQNSNPLNILRLVNGEWTTKAIHS